MVSNYFYDIIKQLYITLSTLKSLFTQFLVIFWQKFLVKFFPKNFLEAKSKSPEKILKSPIKPISVSKDAAGSLVSILTLIDLLRLKIIFFLDFFWIQSKNFSRQKFWENFFKYFFKGRNSFEVKNTWNWISIAI